MSGFPVLLVDPAKVEAVDPVSRKVTFANERSTQIGGELIATPTIADLTGNGRPEIVVGAQEQYDETVAVWPPSAFRAYRATPGCTRCRRMGPLQAERTPAPHTPTRPPTYPAGR
ncbi:MAG: hypothetical protein M5U19_21420 [Microthrixaceae bacterium]|nr:hypothetical protein [Microthrixaceae bacterium]